MTHELTEELIRRAYSYVYRFQRDVHNALTQHASPEMAQLNALWMLTDQFLTGLKEINGGTRP